MRTRLGMIVAVLAAVAGGCVSAQVGGSNALPASEKWESLFDGKTLGAWKSSPFGGEGEVRVDQGRIILEMGSSITGIFWTGGELPKTNYEVRLEAMKLDGNDFFCGLTFPVGESSCSFIVGGWGGGVVGLSSLDGMDASENDTSKLMSFAKNRWYRIRARVTPERIQCWIDDKKEVDAPTSGRRISIRPEVDLSRPLGIASYEVKAALRAIELRRLP